MGLCSECLAEELREQQEEIELEGTRVCSSCGDRRALDQFYGRSKTCKACRRLKRPLLGSRHNESKFIFAAQSLGDDRAIDLGEPLGVIL